MSEKEKSSINIISINSCWSDILKLFNFVLISYSVYLSFRCNNGFDLKSFIIAILFPWFYVLYNLGVKDGC